jgi:hypothetical protein
MPSTYSPNLRTELIANGEQSGTWGNTTNVNLGTILDSAIAGYTNVTVSSTTAFALTANNGASDQARNMIVQLSGSPGGAFNMFIPPASKFYVLRNTTSNDATISNSTALNGTTASGGETFVLKANTTSLIFSDGTNVREALTGFTGSLTINGDLAVNGNTTLGNARVSGTYTYVSASVIQVNTGSAHGYIAGQSVGFIVTSTTAGNAKSGYYAIIGTPSTTQFNLTYTPGGLDAASSGNCLVTNDTITLNGIVSPGVVIDGSSTIPALRITQTSTGNSFVVDDDLNPDSTPFIIDGSGNVITGNTASLTTFNNSTTTPRIQEIGIIANDAAMGIALFNATNASSGVLDFAKSAAAAVGTYTAVDADEALGLIRFSGSDGTDFAPAASISAAADGATGAGDMPGRLVFNTVPDGSNTLTERMRINNAGNIIVGRGEGTASLTGGTVRAPSGTGTDITGANLVITAGNGTGTGGSGTIAFQTAAPTTTGTAQTSMLTAVAISNIGNVGIGTTTGTNVSLYIHKDISRSTSGAAYGIYQDGQFQPIVTSGGYFVTIANVASGTTLTSLVHYYATEGTYTGTVTTQYGFRSGSDLISATNNYGFFADNTAAVTTGKTAYGFYSSVNTPSGAGTTWGYYGNGTANNYFASNLLLGGGTPAALVNGQVTATNRLAAVADNDEVSIVLRGSSTTTTTGYPVLALQKTLAATAATLTTTTSGSNLGVITFDGVNLNGTPAIAQGAAIATFQDATATTSYVPAGLRVYTTNTVDGIGERMRINSTGTMTLGTTAQNGAALTVTAPAKLYIDDGTYTDSATAASGTVTHGTLVSIDNAAIAATNVSVTYTTASTLYIPGAPVAGTNVTIDYPYALVIDSGNMRLDGYLSQVGTTATANVVPLTIQGLTTATPAAGITTTLNFRTQTGATNTETGASIRAITTDVTAGAENFDLSFLTMAAGAAAAEQFRVTSGGDFKFNSGYGTVATAYGVRAWVNFSAVTATTVSATYTWAGTTCTVTSVAHGFLTGDIVYLNFTSGAGASITYKIFYTVTKLTDDTFSVTGVSLTQATSAAVSYYLASTAGGNVRRVTLGTPGNTWNPPTIGAYGYGIMFTDPMPDVNYAWSGGIGQGTGTVSGWLSGPISVSTSVWKTTTALYVTALDATNSYLANAPEDVNIMVVR